MKVPLGPRSDFPRPTDPARVQRTFDRVDGS